MMNITACIITDGKDFMKLKQCVRSLDKSCNEIIIGANNNSYEYIRMFRSDKIKVIEQVWENDFSKARNEVIKHATGDWVLTIDTDERLVTEIKYLDDRYDFYFVAQNNHSNYVYWNIRLFKNHKGYFYKNKVHESLEHCGVNEKTALKSNIILDHSGYELTQDDIMKKLQRNYFIMKTDFDNPVRNYHLGNYEFLANKNYKKAVEHYELALMDPINAEHKASTYNNLYMCQLFLKYPKEVLLKSLENSIRILPKQKQARIYTVDLLTGWINEKNKSKIIPIIEKELVKIERIQNENNSELYSDLQINNQYLNIKRKEISKWQ